ncbi:hypothetical protein KJ966_10310 [bacterium]|nr:hypothetical protein [bacterium]
MGKQKLHLHSMMVHAIAALAPIAAIAYIILKLEITVLSFDQNTWSFLIIFSIALMLLISIPSIASGLFERGHIYAKWHSTHKAKLLLSVLLGTVLAIELTLLHQSGFEGSLFSPLGILIIFGNTIITFLLCAYGLKITLGRQSLGRLSYEPDLFKKEPFDILVLAGKNRKEEAKFYDLTQER